MAVNVRAHKETQANRLDEREISADSRLLYTHNGIQNGEPGVDDLSDLTMQQLAAAADQGNEAMFLTAKQMIDWSRRPATDFVRAIRWALAAGAFMAARNLATQGTKQYPDHQEVQKFAYLLAPPKVLPLHLPPDPSLRANRDWIRTHSAQYHGQWVALRSGELLATASSLHALTQELGISRDILFTKVF
jgi:hypothetical protein